jgi:hypothetical protein
MVNGIRTDLRKENLFIAPPGMYRRTGGGGAVSTLGIAVR